MTGGADAIDVTVYVSGTAGTAQETATLSAGSGVTAVTLDFTMPTSTLRLGGVVTEPSGAGVADASVRLSGDLYGTTSTDTSGAYSFEQYVAEGITSAALRLEVSHGGLTFERDVVISLDSGAVTEHVEDFELYTTALSINGFVTDEKGVGILGSLLIVRGDIEQWVPTGEDGAYAFSQTFAGDRANATVEVTAISSLGGGDGITRTLSFALIGGETTEHTENFVFRDYPFSLQGQVTDETGAGLPDMRVNITGDLYKTVYTDANGRYELAHTFRGDWPKVALEFRIGEGIDTLYRTIEVVLDSGTLVEHVENFEFRNDLPGRAKWVTYGDLRRLMLGFDETIYTADEQIVAIDTEGNEKWMADVDVYDAVVSTDGTVYGSYFGTHAFDPNGQQKWSSEFGVDTWALAVGQDGTLYIGDENSLVAVNPDGSEQWSVDSSGPVYNLAIGFDGVVYAVMDDLLVAYSPNGIEFWSREVSRPALAIGADGTVYAGSEGLQAINPDGSERWTVTAPSSIDALAIAEDGTLYVGAEDGFYAFDAEGTERWRVSLGDGVDTIAVGADGVIYTNSYRTLHALDPNGVERWRFEAEYYIRELAVGYGVVYVGTHRALYAVNATSDGLAASSWPKSFGDNQNSKRVQR